MGRLSIASKSIRSCIGGVVMFSPNLEKRISPPGRADVGPEITACIAGVTSGSPRSLNLKP